MLLTIETFTVYWEVMECLLLETSVHSHVMMDMYFMAVQLGSVGFGGASQAGLVIKQRVLKVIM